MLRLRADSYLGAPTKLDPSTLLLSSLVIYSSLGAGGAEGGLVCGVVAVLALMLARAPRAAVYSLVFLGLAAFIAFQLWAVANGSRDAGADRDEAVEIGARALLDGQNPWSAKSQLDNPITTGPTSMFLAIPFVLVSGQINALSLLFWLLFLGLLVGGDLRGKNQSFLPICLFLVLPISGLAHTTSWALDELYYVPIACPLLWLSLQRGWWISAGVLATAFVFARLSYAFLVLAIGLWWLLGQRRGPRELLRIAYAGLGSAALILLTLRLTGGKSFWRRNFFRTLLHEPLNSDANPLASALSWLVARTPDSAWAAAAMVLALTLVIAWALRRSAHPFAQVALVMLAAHTVAFSPANPRDYMMVVIIPALYAAAFSAQGVLTKP